METRSASKVKLAAEGRPRRVLKFTEKAEKSKLAEKANKTNKVSVAVKARPKRKPKIAEEPKKTMKRKALVKAPGNEANGGNDSSLSAENEPNNHSLCVPFSSKKTKLRAVNDLVRRSGRLKNVLSEKIQEKKDAPHDEINVTDFDGQVELHVEPISSKPTRVVRGKKPFTSEATQSVNYKSLYIDSQKKIDASTEENYKRAVELSYLRGKVDAYEYIIGNMKNLVAFSNMTRLIDGEMNLSNGTAPALHPDNEC